MFFGVYYIIYDRVREWIQWMDFPFYINRRIISCTLELLFKLCSFVTRPIDQIVLCQLLLFLKLCHLSLSIYTNIFVCVCVNVQGFYL